jgi:hypothetical protein
MTTIVFSGALYKVLAKTYLWVDHFQTASSLYMEPLLRLELLF